MGQNQSPVFKIYYIAPVWWTSWNWNSWIPLLQFFPQPIQKSCELTLSQSWGKFEKGGCLESIVKIWKSWQKCKHCNPEWETIANWKCTSSSSSTWLSTPSSTWFQHHHQHGFNIIINTLINAAKYESIPTQHHLIYIFHQLHNFLQSFVQNFLFSLCPITPRVCAMFHLRRWWPRSVSVKECNAINSQFHAHPLPFVPPIPNLLMN